jgi:phenylpyruvate tautomerase PptA (4-oxalocrotonate tautomerase family)
MPMLEVIRASEEPLNQSQKQAFVQDVVEIFRDVLGTPDGRLRLFFTPVEWEDSIVGLLPDDADLKDKK